MDTPTATELHQGPPVQPELLNIEDSARLLGIATSHLHNLKKAGKFGPKPVKMGRAVRYLRSELLAWSFAQAPNQARWDVIRDVTMKKFLAA